MRAVLRHWFSLLAERRCAACGSPVAGAPDPALCPACTAALSRRERGFCPRCGALAAWADAPPAPCGDCIAKPRPWSALFMHAAYEGTLRDILLRFKHKHELPLGALLGTLLAAHPGLRPHAYDAIVPMPLHPARLRERGFNQALELARPLAVKLRAPAEADILRRARHTVPQTSLHYDERHRNVKGIFTARDAHGLRILLVDDIATTGATLEEAAKTLIKAGAATVDAAVAARTPAHYNV